HGRYRCQRAGPPRRSPAQRRARPRATLRWAARPDRCRASRSRGSNGTSRLDLLETAIGEGIVHGLAVLERHHTQILLELGHPDPISNSSVTLHLAVRRIAQRLLTPLTPDIGPLPQDLLFEIPRRLHVRAGRSLFSTRNPSTASTNASGCSRCGACPA